jgi:hypothetical protein
MEEIKKSSMYLEIFEPDATRIDFGAPAGNAADDLCQLIEIADLMEKIVGCTHEEAMKALAPTPAPAPTLSPVSQEGLDGAFRRVVNIVANRVADAIQKAPARKKAIQAIVDEARNKPALRAIRDNARWDCLADSCLAYVAGAVISEAK